MSDEAINRINTIWPIISRGKLFVAPGLVVDVAHRTKLPVSILHPSAQQPVPALPPPTEKKISEDEQAGFKPMTKKSIKNHPAGHRWG